VASIIDWLNLKTSFIGIFVKSGSSPMHTRLFAELVELASFSENVFKSVNLIRKDYGLKRICILYMQRLIANNFEIMGRNEYGLT